MRGLPFVFSFILVSCTLAIGQQKTHSVNNDPDNNYSVTISVAEDGKQYLSLNDKALDKNFRLGQSYSEFTHLERFDLLAEEGVKYLFFQASDLRYRVSYYWNFLGDRLYYKARDFRDNKDFMSETLKKDPKVAAFVAKHQLNPTAFENRVTSKEEEDIMQTELRIKDNEDLPVVMDGNNEIEEKVMKVSEQRPEVPRSWGSSDGKNSKVVIEQLDEPEQGEEIIDLRNNDKDAYRAVLYNLESGKKALGFGKRGEDYKYAINKIDYTFAANTALTEFEVLKASNIELFHFVASDIDWIVDYYYDINSSKLHYIAKGNQSGKIIRSSELKTYNNLTRYINGHYGRGGSNSRGNGNGGGGTVSNGTSVPNARNLALKFGDYLKRSRIFNLNIENSTNEQITIKEPRLVMIIRGSGGFYREHPLYELGDVTLEGFGFVTLADNFVTEGASGQYLILKDFEENLTFLPALNKGRYDLQVVLFSGDFAVRSNVVRVYLPLP